MLSRLVTGICAVAGCLTGAQFPSFYNQYLQNVSGRLSQVLSDLRPILQDAEARGISVQTYLERAAAESGNYTRKMVEADMNAYQDMRRLEEAYTALSDAAPTMQPFAFAQHMNLETFNAVFTHYTPSLPFSSAGLIYGGSGLLIGLMAAWVLESPLRVWHDARRKRRHRRRRHRTSHAPDLESGADNTPETA